MSSNICIINEGSKNLSAAIIICMNQRLKIPQWLFSETTIIIIIIMLRHFTFKIVVIIFKPLITILSVILVQTTHLIILTNTSIKSETAELQNKKKWPRDGDTLLSHVNKPTFLMN